MRAGRHHLRRTAQPSHVMGAVLILMVLCPTAFIAGTDYYTALWNYLSPDQYRGAATTALWVAGVFTACFLAGLVTHRLASAAAPAEAPAPQAATGGGAITLTYQGQRFHLRLHRAVFWAGLASALAVWIVFLTGGYEKIALYGQNIDRLDYRLIGANDRNRALTAILQIARRLVLPFAVVYFVVLGWYTSAYGRGFVAFLILSLIVSVVTTLDRAPLMMIIVMLFYVSYLRARSLVRLFAIAGAGVLAMVLLGGAMTFVQYNIQGFTFDQVLLTGLDFITNRAVMAPNFVPIELSYGLFDLSSDKLYLRHSRLMALFTGSYVGTIQANSIYVGPVGAIADIWRNLGFFGVFFIGFLLGLFFAHLDRAMCGLDPAAKAAVSFTVISLVFYFFYGTFFSQGVFLQIFVLLWAVHVFRRDGSGVATRGEAGPIHGVPA